MKQFQLVFSTAPQIELLSSYFFHPLACCEHRCVRGKSANLFDRCGSFQWTRAVQALCALLLRYKLFKNQSAPQYYLQGCRGTLAASLDYALSKQPLWLLDMFGVDSQGKSITSRFFLRHNSNRKLPGPVMIGVNSKLIEPNDIVIYIGNTRISDETEFRALLLNLENSGTSASNIYEFPLSSTKIKLIA